MRVKIARGWEKKYISKAIFFLTEMLYLQTNFTPTQDPHSLILFMLTCSLEESLKYADPALLDLKKLIKTTPSSWLKQLCFSQKALQTAQKVMKIILSISVWSVHLQRRLVQVKVSTSVNENNSWIHHEGLFLLPHLHRCESLGCRHQKGNPTVIQRAWETWAQIRKAINFCVYLTSTSFPLLHTLHLIIISIYLPCTPQLSSKK